MIAYLTKSDTSEGFNQIIDFLNGSSIQYALTVNPNIYVSCIKQFWKSVAMKKADEGDAEVNVDDVPAVGVAAEGDVSAADDVVSTAVEEPSIPSPTPPTLPPQLLQDQPSTSQIAQAMEITKLKSRVKKLERRNTTSKLQRLKKVGTTQRIETSDDTVMDDVSKQERMIADIDADVDVTLKDVAADVKDVDAQDAKIDEKPAELQEVVEVVTTAKLITEVVTAAIIRDPEESATPSTIVHTEAKSKDKGKEILVEEPKPLKKQAQIKQDEKYTRDLEAELNKNIDWDEVIDHIQRKQKEDKAMKRYQALKRKPQTEAQARKNMMIYLRNMAGFKMDYFKGMAYDDIRPIFEKKFNSNKLDEEVEELKRHLQIVPNDDDDVYTEATPLARKVPVVDYETYNENNKPYYKIKRADGSHQLYMSFLKRRYPLIRFTLNQLINNVQLEVEEESEVSLELLSFGVDAAMDFKENMLSV
nr:hypothetical protein [Tanacetum cinerariifolium]